MSLTDAYKGARIIETLENYGVTSNVEVEPTELSGKLLQFATEKDFWQTILSNPELSWGSRVTLHDFVVSEWVPRIPGLYFSEGAEKARQRSQGAVARRGRSWIEYNPLGKSSHVLGGVGDLLFPPDSNGNRLATLSSSGQTSPGIPVLIPAKFYDHPAFKNGCLLKIKNLVWTKMSMEWVQRFQPLQGIPRGYLAIDSQTIIDIVETRNRIECQPVTIMEYESGGGLFWDYVFVSSELRGNYERDEMADFFKYYRTKENRNGRYLIACDMANPLFDAQFNSPLEMTTEYHQGHPELLNN